MDPLALCFNLYTHLHPTLFIFGRGGTSDQVPFCWRASNSAAIAFLHSGLLTELLKQVGSIVLLMVLRAWMGWRVAVSTFCLRVPSLFHVTIGCTRALIAIVGGWEPNVVTEVATGAVPAFAQVDSSWSVVGEATWTGMFPMTCLESGPVIWIGTAVSKLGWVPGTDCWWCVVGCQVVE